MGPPSFAPTAPPAGTAPPTGSPVASPPSAWGGGPGWAQSGTTGTEGRSPAATGPGATRDRRVGARAVDLVVELVVGLALVVAFGLGERPVAAVVLVWLVAAVYEAAAVAMFGATLGKRNTRIVVLPLDSADREVPLDQAIARGAAAAATVFGPATCVVVAFTNAAPVLLVGGVIWAAVAIAGTLNDPLGRGAADRVASTIVTSAATEPPIRSRDLPGYADAARPPRVGPLGRVGDLDVRVRARLRRLNDATALVAVVAVLGLTAVLPFSEVTVLVVATVAWIVAFVVDETRRVAGPGTAGHRLAGLVVRDRRTGAPLSTGRSAARAITLALLLYVPLLWPILIVSTLMMRADPEARGLHDRIANTVVVADPTLDPEVQRRRAMRVRLGRVG